VVNLLFTKPKNTLINILILQEWEGQQMQEKFAALLLFLQRKKGK
jgi:hypothetical protein